MKRAIKASMVGVLFLVVIVGFNPNNDRYFQIVKNLDIFATLFKEVNAYYVDEINPNKLMKDGIDAMDGSDYEWRDNLALDANAKLSLHS